MKYLISLSPFFALFGGYVYHYNSQITSTVLTVEDCVTETWTEFESRTGQMPSIQMEHQFRNECWDSMGAKIN